LKVLLAARLTVMLSSLLPTLPAYNVFHAFVGLNIKPQLRYRKPGNDWVWLIAAESMRILKDRMAREGSRSFPVCYQVVVRCALDRSLALNWAYEAHRTLEQPPLID
jgi:hypothetical protein